MKILIISYAPLCLYSNGGKSFLSLFQTFKTGDLIQFYINPGFPDGEWCSSFYQQKESDLIKPFHNKKINHLVNSEKAQNAVSEHKPNNRFRSLKLLIRDFAWFCFFKVDKKLDKWIKDNKPNYILSDTGDSSFLYKISMKISKLYNIPVAGYFGDNYYAVKCESWNLVKRFQLFLLRKTIKKFVQTNKKNIFVNYSYRDFFKQKFSLPEKSVFTIFNGTNFDFSNCSNYSIKDKNSIKFSYIGNLSLGRGDNIIRIGQSLSQINKKLGTKHKVIVYAKDVGGFENKCKSVDSIIYMGSIPGNEVKNAILESDILIHTESFNCENINLTKYSMSTKIGDSLASGKCLIAFGPEELSSIKYLIDEKCAFCITSYESLTEKLTNLVSNPGLILNIGNQARIVASKNHDSKKNSEFLKSILSN